MKNEVREILSKSVVVCYNSEVAKRVGVFGAILLTVPNFENNPQITQAILSSTGLTKNEAVLGLRQLIRVGVIDGSKVVDNE